MVLLASPIRVVGVDGRTVRSRTVLHGLDHLVVLVEITLNESSSFC